MMLVVVKQNGIETCFLTNVVIYHKMVTLGWSTKHFTRWFQSYGLCRIQSSV